MSAKAHRDVLALDVAPIEAVVRLHVEEAAHLRHVRSAVVRGPRVGLLQLGRLDERIAAHLDGIAVAGATGARLCVRALERTGSGELFVATVDALERRDARRLEALVAIAETVVAGRPGLLSAFGWVSAACLRGVTMSLLESRSAWRREVGLAACGMHRVDPGGALGAAVCDDDVALRARALHVAGLCGRLDLVDACLASMADPAHEVAFAGAHAALLLGNRGAALEALHAFAIGPGEHGRTALRLALQVMPSSDARTLLARLAKAGPAWRRRLLEGIAIAGDPHYVPWLIAQMDEMPLARQASQAFAFITGLDLPTAGLDQRPPPVSGEGPNDDPDGQQVMPDEDDGVPWPDRARIAAWWHANGGRFVAGRRHFMGQPPGPAHNLSILRTGWQRQRLVAAYELTLATPGMPLFDTVAQARRQQRRLATMAAP